jgi:hypothetical protein
MRWKHSFGDERLAFCDVNGIVQIQYGNGSSADCREADQQGASPTKVPVPPIAARMVERAQLARLRIKPRDVRTFERVAVATRVDEIVIVAYKARDRRLRLNVIDAERLISIGKPTFATQAVHAAKVELIA